MAVEQAMNPVPPVILAVAGMMIAVEAGLAMAGAGMLGGGGGLGWRGLAVENYAFAPRALELLVEGRGWHLDVLKRFVTYAFVHQSTTQAVFAVVITLAMGKFSGEVLSGAALGVLCLACTVGAAVVFGVLVGQNTPLFGGYPLAYGLIGAYTAILFVSLGRQGQRQIAAFRLIGFLVILQLVFSVFFGPAPTWIAELAGFAIGFALTPLLAPGGWAALLARVRAR